MISNTLKQVVHFPKLVRNRVWFLWTCSLLFQMGFLFVWILTSTLFLKIFGVKNIPFLFIAEGLLIMLGSWVTRKYFLQTKTNYFLKKIIWVLLMVIGVSVVFFQHNLGFILGVALLAKSLIYPQLQLGLFKKIESFFTPHIAQKAIPFIETAETIGLVLGSAFVLIVLQLSNSLLSLFYWWAFPLVLLLFLIKREPQLVQTIKEFSVHKIPRIRNSLSVIDGAQFLRRNFIRGVVGMVLLQAALFAVLEISFLHEVQTHHEVIVQDAWSFDFLQANLFDIAEKAQILEQKVVSMAGKTVAHELGFFALITGLIALFFKLFLTPRLLKKLGVFGAILSYLSFFAMGVLSFFFGKSSAEILKGIQHGTYSLFASPYHISFYACNEKIREKLRHLLHGIIWPLGSMLGAGIIWFVLPASWGLLALVVTLLLIGWYLNRHFAQFTLENFQTAESVEEKIHMLEMLESFQGDEQVAKSLSQILLQKNQPSILRQKIIATLQEIQVSSVVHAYLHILNNQNESDEIKIHVLEALYADEKLKMYCRKKAFTEHKLFETWQNLFTLTQHSHVKKLALMNMFKHISNAKTVDFFRDMLVSGDEHLLSICLRSCMQFDDPEILNELLPKLEHESSRIRSHVILAIWKFYHNKDYLRSLLHNMIDDLMEEHIISGVYAVGELKLKDFIPKLEQKLPSKTGVLRVQILIALLKLGKTEYVQSLSRIITGPNVSLARMAFYMRKRLPQTLQEEIEDAVYKQVSVQVDRVLSGGQSIQSLPEEKRSYFKQLFLFSEQYESLLSLG
ncbi:hypothetical protein CSB37_00860 [bacterium DOLZORAL124_38_8]|nr:MAG: hypothetical protein CSB37_00860 [bacterium DOLZORAL124_38_8]